MAPDDLRQLGFSLQKGRAMIELARSIIGKDLDLEGLAVLPDAEAIECLCGLRGVERWSAEYVLLRGLCRIPVFRGDDVGARKSGALPEPGEATGLRGGSPRFETLAPVCWAGLLSLAAGPSGGSGIPAGRRIAATDKLPAIARIQNIHGRSYP